VGPGAAAALAQCLETLRCPVRLERSDWQIGAAEPAMLARMADEAVEVARQVAPDAQARIAGWRMTRAAQIDAAQASLLIGHIDLLAVPDR